MRCRHIIYDIYVCYHHLAVITSHTAWWRYVVPVSTHAPDARWVVEEERVCGLWGYREAPYKRCRKEIGRMQSSSEGCSIFESMEDQQKGVQLQSKSGETRKAGRRPWSWRLIVVTLRHRRNNPSFDLMELFTQLTVVISKSRGQHKYMTEKHWVQNHQNAKEFGGPYFNSIIRRYEDWKLADIKSMMVNIGSMCVEDGEVFR